MIEQINEKISTEKIEMEARKAVIINHKKSLKVLDQALKNMFIYETAFSNEGLNIFDAMRAEIEKQKTTLSHYEEAYNEAKTEVRKLEKALKILQ